MKLPGINYNTPVQSLGRENINLPAQKANINKSIADTAISAMAEFAQNKLNKTLDIDTEDANNAYTISRSQSMDAVNRLLSMNTYSPDDLDESILYKESKPGLAEDGSEIEITRKSINASEVNPQLFERTMKNIRSQGNENLTAEASKMFDKQFDKLYYKYREQIMNDNRNKSVKDRVTDVIQASMKLAGSGDFAGAALNIQASNMPQAMKSQQIAKIDMLAEDAQVLSAINNQDLQMMEYNLNRMKDDGYEGPYSALKRKQSIRDLENGIDSALSDAEEMITRKAAKDYGNLIVSSRRGETTYTEIENAWDSGLIKTGTQYSALMSNLDNFYNQETKEKKALIDVNKILATDDMMFSPTNRDQVTAVNTFFAENPSPQLAISLAKKGILVTQIKDTFSAFNRGGSIKKVAEVSRLYADMARAAPKAVADIPEKHRNDMGNMAELIAAGVNGEEAVKILDRWENRSEAERKVIDANYSKTVLNGVPQKKYYEKNYVDLADKLNGDDKYDKTFWGMGGAPAPSIAMVTEYDMLKRRYYQTFNDMQKAGNRAYEIMTSTWDYSEINGKANIVKYGVENEYNMTTKGVKSQLKAELKELGITQEVKLTNTSDTPTNKSYQISDVNGLPIYGKDNQPLRQWKPDYESYAKTKAANEKKKEADRKEEARKERELEQYEIRRRKLTSETDFNKSVGFYGKSQHKAAK